MKGRKRIERRCRCCRGALRPEQLWICDECQALGRGRTFQADCIDAEELLRVARAREKAGADPLREMGMEEISALAWRFRKTGYGSYGKLRAYVHNTGKLPPIDEAEEMRIC